MAMDEKKVQIVKKLAFDMADKIKRSDLSEMELTYDDVKISVRRNNTQAQLVAQAASAAPTVSVEVPTLQEDEPSGNIVKTPIVGTFYRSASPESEPFIKIGSRVARGDILFIVEAMKMLNEIESEFAGEVKQILVSDGDMVEFGQPIIVIE
ncbi:MAG: acetyl-CoA carboxylase biotin carboxyl carrier protein [Clostridia bacterium]